MWNLSAPTSFCFKKYKNRVKLVFYFMLHEIVSLDLIGFSTVLPNGSVVGTVHDFLINVIVSVFLGKP